MSSVLKFIHWKICLVFVLNSVKMNLKSCLKYLETVYNKYLISSGSAFCLLNPLKWGLWDKVISSKRKENKIERYAVIFVYLRNTI